MVGGAVLGATAVLAALLVLADRPEWWRGLLAASVVSALAAAASLVPLIWGLRDAVNRAASGYLLAIGVRMAVSVAGCHLAVKVGSYPAAPTLLLMVAIYLTVLVVETAAVARPLWSAAIPPGPDRGPVN
jgi:hypothetical protein